MNDLERRVLEDFSDDIGAPSGLVAERLGMKTSEVTRIAKKFAADGLLRDTGYAMKKDRRGNWQYTERKSEGGMIAMPGASTVWELTQAGREVLESGTAQEKTMTTLTQNEQTVLRAIAKNEFQDDRTGANLIGNYIYSDGIASDAGISRRSIAGVFSSLSKKGLIKTSAGPRKSDDTVALTAAGVEALEAPSSGTTQERTMQAKRRDGTGKKILKHGDPEYAKHDPYNNYRDGVIVGASQADEVRTADRSLLVFAEGAWHNVHPPGGGSLPHGAYGIRWTLAPHEVEKYGLSVKQESHMHARKRKTNDAEARGEQYARDQVEGDYFHEWVYDQMVEASQMDPSEVMPLETEEDAKEVARNVLQQLEWDTKRDLNESREFFEGFDKHLRDPGVVDWLADEVLNIHHEIRGTNPDQLPLPGVSEANRQATKPGKHGTLRLWLITYKDADNPAFGEDAIRKWAYDKEAASLGFYENNDGDSWEIVKIEPVLDTGPKRLSKAREATSTKWPDWMILESIEKGQGMTPQAEARAMELSSLDYIDMTGTWKLTAKGKRALQRRMDRIVEHLRGTNPNQLPLPGVGEAHGSKYAKKSETELISLGRCPWETASGMPWTRRCGRKVESGHFYCSQHERDWRDLYALGGAQLAWRGAIRTPRRR